MIGVYHGTSKPTNLCDYLHDFIGDLKTVVKDGFVFKNKVFRVNIPDAFICDATARSFLKCVKGYGGYYGCERCVQKVEHFRSRIIFPETEASLRNDKQFADNFYQNYQTGTSPFQDLGIGMVSQFVFDYMRLVCLGVVRRIINFWVPSRGAGILPMRIANWVSDDLLSLKRLLPCEFSHKP